MSEVWVRDQVVRRFAWMLAVPYFVVTSTHSLATPRWGNSMEVEHLMYITDGQETLECQGIEICEDLAEALRAAHERRLWPDPKKLDAKFAPRIIFTDMGAMPCCENMHKGAVCTICDDHQKNEKDLSIPGIPVPCCEDSYNNGACIVCGKSDQ